jgi:hypothetical protein
VWAAFFLYEIFVSSRLTRLGKDLDRLKEQLRQK